MVISLAIAGCRPDPGTPDYSSHAGLRAAPDAGEGPSPGPDPWVPGEPRAAFGLFYEGGATVTFEPNERRHYYIFVIDSTGALTYEQDADDEHVEGVVSDRFTLAGTPWWGGGLVWDDPTDLSAWTTLHVSLSTQDEGFADLDVSMLSGTGSPAGAAVKATAYGFATDGEWHHLEIPLADFVAKGFDKAKCRGPFVLGGVGKGGDSLLVDAVYLE